MIPNFRNFPSGCTNLQIECPTYWLICKSKIDDSQFFKLSEMERFLESEDAAEERRRLREEKGDKSDDDDGDIDYFGVGDADDEDGEEDEESGGRAKYADYFGGKPRKAQVFYHTAVNSIKLDLLCVILFVFRN